MKKINKMSFIALVIPLMSFTAQRQVPNIRTIEQQLIENLAQKTVAQINSWYDQAHEKISAYSRNTKNTAKAEILLDKLNKKYFGSTAIKNLLPGTINYENITASGRGLAPQAASARLRQIDIEISKLKQTAPTTAAQLLTDANKVIDSINQYERSSGNEARAAEKRNMVVAYLRPGLEQFDILTLEDLAPKFRAPSPRLDQKMEPSVPTEELKPTAPRTQPSPTTPKTPSVQAGPLKQRAQERDSFKTAKAGGIFSSFTDFTTRKKLAQMVLGVSARATKSQINQSHKDKLSFWHPDKVSKNIEIYKALFPSVTNDKELKNIATDYSQIIEQAHSLLK